MGQASGTEQQHPTPLLKKEQWRDGRGEKEEEDEEEEVVEVESAVHDTAMLE